VIFSMRRTIFMALVAALLLPSLAWATPPVKIQRDCADDGVLEGTYSASDLRKARDELPTDADEYSDCRDVLARAIAAKAAGSGGGTPTPTPSPGSDSGGGGTGDGTTTSPDGAATPAPTAAPAETFTPEDDAAVAKAGTAGAAPVEVGGRPVSPGTSRLAADVGRNGLPGSLLFVFGLMAVGTIVAVLLPLIRRRVSTRHPR
jgi:hypothetical protein